jgi:hypothetical protein
MTRPGLLNPEKRGDDAARIAGTGEASGDIQTRQKPDFTTGRRLSAICLCAVLGPFLTGILLAFQGFFVVPADFAIRPVWELPIQMLFLGTMASVIGFIPTFVCGLFALHLCRRSPTVPWWAFAGVGLVVVGLMLLMIQMDKVPRAPLSSLLEASAVFAAPILLSSVLCWRITRRWHSPEPSP